MNEDNAKKLYDALTSKGVNVGTYEVYKSHLGNEDDRKLLFDYAQKSGINVGTYEQMDSALSVKPTSIEEPKPVQGVKNTQVEQTTQTAPQNNDFKVDESKLGEPANTGSEKDSALSSAPTFATPGNLALMTASNRGELNKQNDYRAEQKEKEKKELADNNAIGQMNTAKESADKEVESKRWGSYIPNAIGKAFGGTAFGIAGSYVGGKIGELMGDLLQRAVDDDYSQARVIQERVKQTDELLKEAEHSDASGWDKHVVGLLRGVYNKAMNVRTFDFGANDLVDGITTNKVLDKFEKGEELTATEQSLLNAIALTEAIQSAYEDDISMFYRVGESVPQSAGFAMALATNPSSGLGQKVAQSAVKKLSKQAARQMFGKWGVKTLYGASRFGGDLAEMGVATATTGLARTGATVAERREGKAFGEFNEDGTYKYVGSEREGLGEATWKGITSAFLENASEGWGEYMTPMEGVIRKWAANGVKDKAFFKKAVNVMLNTSDDEISKMVASYKKATRFNGVLGEYSEEVLNNMANAITTGDMNFTGGVLEPKREDFKTDAEYVDAYQKWQNSVLNLNTNLETFLSCVAMIAPMKVVELGGRAYNTHTEKMRLNAAENNLSRVYDGDNGSYIANKFQEAKDFKEMSQVYTDLLNQNMISTPEESKAVMDYLRQLVNYQTLNVRDAITAKNEDVTVSVSKAAYNAGQSLLNQGKDSRKASADTELSKKKAVDVLGEGIVSALENYDPNSFAVLTRSMNDEQRGAAKDYYYNLRRMEGIEDAYANRVNIGVESFIKSIPETAKQTGNLTTATLKSTEAGVEDSPVNVIELPSDGGLAVVEVNGEKKQVPVSQLSNIQTNTIDDLVNAEKDRLIADTEARYARMWHNKRTQVPQVGLQLHENVTDQANGETAQNNYLVTAVSEDGKTVTYVPSVFDANTGTEVPQSGASTLTMSADDALAMQDAWYDAEDGINIPQQAVADVAEQESTEEPAQQIDVVSQLEQTDEGVQGMQQVDQWINNDEEDVESLIDTMNIGQQTKDLLKQYAVQQTNPVQPEQPVQPTQPTQPVQPEQPVDNTHDEWRNKDGEFDDTLMMRSGDAKGVAEALVNEYGDSAIEAVNGLIAIAQDTVDKEKNPLRKLNKAKEVNFWKNVLAEIQGTPTTSTTNIPQGGPTAAEQRRDEANKISEEARQNFPKIVEKWENAPKVNGRNSVYIMPDGTRLKGHYVLTEEGSYTPSHDPHTFEPNEGFPTTEQGKTANSRDYKTSDEAKATVIANGQSYNGNALQDKIVVSQDGIVYSGNNRTMSGQLAAENGTDQEYIDVLNALAEEFGFKPEDVASMQHPRVVFVADAEQGLDYTPTTFDRFNTQREKGESANDQAVRLGKVLSDEVFKKISDVISKREKLSDVYKSQEDSKDIVDIMQSAGIVTQGTRVNFLDARGLLTDQGKQTLESALIGKVFSENEDVVRYLSEMPGVRKNVIAAIKEISENRMLGEYSLADEIGDAIELVYKATKANNSIDDYYDQGDFTQDVRGLYNYAVKALAKTILGEGKFPLKVVLTSYNSDAQGGSLFEELTRSTLLAKKLHEIGELPDAEYVAMLTGGETKTEEPTAEEPTTEEPTAEEPTTEEPTAEEPTTEEPTADEDKNEKIEDYIKRGFPMYYVYTEGGRKQYQALNAENSSVIKITAKDYKYAEEHGGRVMTDEHKKIVDDLQKNKELRDWFVNQFPHRELDEVIETIENGDNDFSKKTNLPKLYEYRELEKNRRAFEKRLLEIYEEQEKPIDTNSEEPTAEEAENRPYKDLTDDELQRKYDEAKEGIDYWTGEKNRSEEELNKYQSELDTAKNSIDDYNARLKSKIDELLERAKNNPSEEAVKISKSIQNSLESLIGVEDDARKVQAVLRSLSDKLESIVEEGTIQHNSISNILSPEWDKIEECFNRVSTALDDINDWRETIKDADSEDKADYANEVCEDFVNELLDDEVKDEVPFLEALRVTLSITPDDVDEVEDIDTDVREMEGAIDGNPAEIAALNKRLNGEIYPNIDDISNEVSAIESEFSLRGKNITENKTDETENDVSLQQETENLEDNGTDTESGQGTQGRDITSTPIEDLTEEEARAEKDRLTQELDELGDLKQGIDALAELERVGLISGKDLEDRKAWAENAQRLIDLRERLAGDITNEAINASFEKGKKTWEDEIANEDPQNVTIGRMEMSLQQLLNSQKKAQADNLYELNAFYDGAISVVTAKLSDLRSQQPVTVVDAKQEQLRKDAERRKAEAQKWQENQDKKANTEIEKLRERLRSLNTSQRREYMLEGFKDEDLKIAESLLKENLLRIRQVADGKRYLITTGKGHARTKEIADDLVNRAYDILNACFENTSNVRFEEIKREFDRCNHDADGKVIDEDMQRIFDAVYNALRYSGIKIRLIDNNSNIGGDAFYDGLIQYGSNYFFRGSEDGFVRNLLVHELLHGISQHAIHAVQGDRWGKLALTSPAMIEGAKELLAIYDEVKKRTGYSVDSLFKPYRGGSGNYGTKNVHEMTADVFEMREGLKKLNLWEKFLDALHKLIFGDETADAKKTDAYKATISAIEKILSDYQYQDYVAIQIAERKKRIRRNKNASEIGQINKNNAPKDSFDKELVLPLHNENKELNNEQQVVYRKRETRDGVNKTISSAASLSGGNDGRRTSSDGQRRGTRKVASSQEVFNEIERSARENGVWYDRFTSVTDGAQIIPHGSGGESLVYPSKTKGLVVKTNRMSSIGSLRPAENLRDFVDRINAHNELFPSAAYRVLGFSRDVDDHICILLEQPYVEKASFSTPEGAKKYLTGMGFTDDSFGSYHNDKYLISDVSPSNILYSRGAFFPIDLGIQHIDVSRRSLEFEESPLDKSDIRFRSNQSTTNSEETDKGVIRGSVQSLADELNVPVTIADNISDFPNNVQKVFQAEKERTRKKYGRANSTPGLYHNGKVYILLSDCADVNDGIRTVLHEIVGHKGLRELVGDKNYKDFLLGLYEMMSKTDKDAINSKASNNGWDVAKATDEYLAEQAEDGKNYGLWDRITKFFNDWFRKLFPNHAPNLNSTDVRYLLWRSRKKLTNDDAFDMATDNLFRQVISKAPNKGVTNSVFMSRVNPGDFVKKGAGILSANNISNRQFQADLDDYHSDKLARMLDMAEKKGEKSVKYVAAIAGNVYLCEVYQDYSVDVLDSKPYSETNFDALYDRIGSSKGYLREALSLPRIRQSIHNTDLERILGGELDEYNSMVSGRDGQNGSRTGDVRDVESRSRRALRNESWRALDAGYHAAVVRGDTEAAEEYIAEAAKRAGYTYKGYHSSFRDFTKFVDGYRGSLPEHSVDELAAAGWFSNEKQNRYGNRLYSMFIRMDNPFIIPGDAVAMRDAKRRVDEVREAMVRVERKYDNDSTPLWQIKEVREARRQYKEAQDAFDKLKFENEPFYIASKLGEEHMKDYPQAKTYGEAARMFLKDQGYDGVILQNTDADMAGGEDWYLPFEGGSQIKSSEITRDDDGNIISLSSRFNELTDDFRFRSVPKTTSNNSHIGNPMTEGSMRQAWDKLMDSFSVRGKEAYVDYLTAVDEFQKFIGKHTGKKVLDSQDAYSAMIQLSSKNKAEMDKLDNFLVDPLNKAIYALIGSFKKFDEGPAAKLVDYVEAKHGIERSRDMAVRIALKKQAKNDAKAQVTDILSPMQKEVSKLTDKISRLTYDRDRLREERAELKKNGATKETIEEIDGKIRVIQDKINEARSERADKNKEIEAKIKDIKENPTENKIKSEDDFYLESLDKWYEAVAKTREDAVKENWSWRKTQETLDKIALDNFGVDEITDMAGLTEMFGDDKDDEGNVTKSCIEKAYEYVEDYEGQNDADKLHDLWAAINGITGYSLIKQQATGLTNKKYLEDQLRRYEFFVPLRGHVDPSAEEVYDYINDQRVEMGNPARTAKGRKSKADNPFGNMLNIAYRSISSGNRNAALQSFYNLATSRDANGNNATNGLAVLSKVWLKNEGTKENPNWILTTPDIDEYTPSEDIPGKLEEFENKMKDLEKEGMAIQEKKGTPLPPYRFDDKNNISAHQVKLYVGGRMRIITITANPRVAQALNGQLNPDTGDTARVIKSINNFMAGAFTSYNVSFSAANLVRDTLHSNMRTFIMENPRYWAKFTAKQKMMLGNGANWTKMMKLLANYNNNEEPKTETERNFKRFMEGGGATGFTMIRSQEESIRTILKELDSMKHKKIKKFNPKNLFDLFAFVSEASELVNRFIAYETSLEMGRTHTRAISDAKETTLNFNRKGAGLKSKVDTSKQGKNKYKYRLINAIARYSQFGRNGIVFFNAHVQGSYQLYEMAKAHPAKFATAFTAVPMTVAAMVLPYFNNVGLPYLYAALGWGGGDDDDYYDSLSDWERQHNLCVRMPGKWWMKIPLTPELSAFFAIGDAAGAAYRGKREMTWHDWSNLLDLVSPSNVNFSDSQTAVNAVLPTILQPGAHILTNKDFKGSTLRKETMWNKNDPQYRKVFRNVSPILVDASRMWNNMIGGNDYTTGGFFDVHPTTLREMMTGLAGGWASTTLAIADGIYGAVKGKVNEKSYWEGVNEVLGDMIDYGRVPVISRFIVSGRKGHVDAQTRSLYYKEVKEKYGLLETNFKNIEKDYKKAVNGTDEMEFSRMEKERNDFYKSDDFKLYEQLQTAVKTIDTMLKNQEGDEMPETYIDLMKEAIQMVRDSRNNEKE